METRLAKIVMCLALGGFASLVAIDNVLDYGTNFTFVHHVLGMDSTPADSPLHDRAITTPALWHAAYALIIAGEAGTGLFYCLAAAALFRARAASPAVFQRAKRWAATATAMGFLVWFFGFDVVGGEWFAMWRSQHWNGQDRAFTIIMIMLAVMIFVNQPDHGTD